MNWTCVWCGSNAQRSGGVLIHKGLVFCQGHFTLWRQAQDLMHGFTCPRCGRVSHNPNDIRERYCGACGNNLLPKGDRLNPPER